MNGSPWRWMLPAIATPFMFVLAVAFQFAFGDSPLLVQLACQMGLFGTMCILAISAWSAYHNFYAWEEVERQRDRQRAASITPITLMAEALRGMHPEAVRALAKFGIKTVWQVEPGKDGQDLDWVLSNTAVRMGFIEYVLNNSTHASIMSKRTLVEGAFKFDPDSLVTDYEQYDQLLAWFKGRMMVTDSYGNMPARWMPPYNPQNVRAKMGLSEPEVKLAATD